MNLETKLDRRLWEAIRSSAESRNFKGAVLDAIHLLTDVIRERSGLDGDGVALIGQAFGGTSPKLKVNRLQTESEINAQRGIEAILRGVYQAIRNPRSHEQHQDTERDAQAVILFIDYLLRVVDESRSPFSLPTFVARVIDPDFVPSERYATLLVDEIPQGKRLAVCREVFARRGEAFTKNAGAFHIAVLKVMRPEEISELATLLSDELRTTDDDDTIRFVLGGYPESIWPTLDEVARLRIENKLIKSISEGRLTNGDCVGGALGTWAIRILGHLSLKHELWFAVTSKLKSPNAAEQEYAFNYFMVHAQQAFDAPPRRLVIAINEGLRAGDNRFKYWADQWATDDFDQRPPDHAWREPFAKALAEFKEAPQVSNDDDIPF